MKVKSLSHVGLLATPWTAAHQAPLSMGFSRQDYWSGVPSPYLAMHFKNQRHYFAKKDPSAVHGVVKSHKQLIDFTFNFHFHALEKEMATHSSVLAWRIPGMGEPGGLPSMGSQRVRHD